jgi:hypothetical protein
LKALNAGDGKKKGAAINTPWLSMPPEGEGKIRLNREKNANITGNDEDHGVS